LDGGGRDRGNRGIGRKPAVKRDDAATEIQTEHVTAIPTCSVQQSEEENGGPESGNVDS
jgi:hypothetical protein